MPTTEWQQLQEIFETVSALPRDERESALDRLCADNAKLRTEVEALLRSPPEEDDHLLGTPIGDGGVRGLTEAKRDPLIGERIGRYRIKNIIARGGMGTVYEAVQEQPHRVVALKVMHRNIASRSALRRFQYESQILGRLRHPNIAQVFEAGMHDDGAGGVPYFAMEYIPGAPGSKSITEYAAAKDLDIRRRLELVARVCDGVHHGHQKGIIHRDLKPANVLVDSSSGGGGGEPKVIDFGVARATDSDLAVTTQQTDIGQLIGTMQYMSPEQCDGDPHDLDTRSDVYSLGVVLYELLTGKPPYEATSSTIYQAARMIREAEPLRPGALNRRLRGDLETIILKALEKDRDRRYQSAEELKKEIERYLKGEPIEARRAGVWVRTVKWAGRHPAMATGSLCALIVALTVPASFGVGWWLNRVPARLAASSDKYELTLYARSDAPLRTWRSGRRSTFSFVPLVSDAQTAGLGRMLIIGFPDAPPDQAFPSFSVGAYAVDESLDEPIWTDSIKAADLPPELAGRPNYLPVFHPRDLMLADIFASPGEEVCVLFQHVGRSQSVLRIYSIQSGEALFEVWHDGNLYFGGWQPAVRQLSLVGLNGEVFWPDRGFPESDSGAHPRVVLAISPEPETPPKQWIRTGSTWGTFDPVWYRCIMPTDVMQRYEARGSREFAAKVGLGEDASRRFGLLIRLLGEKTSFGWLIDPSGNVIPGSANPSNEWQEAQRNGKVLPPETFYLDDLPPIQGTGSSFAPPRQREDGDADRDGPAP